MVRTQIQLSEDQSRLIKSQAAKKGISMAEMIRQCVERQLTNRVETSEKELRLRAMKAAGRFHSGRRDGARDHDALLSEDFAQ
jgi:hypothetical protein